MNLLKDWIRNIVLVVLFINFIEMILPNSSSSNIREDVKMVLGLFIILVILNPILSLTNYQAADFNLTTVVDDKKPSFQRIVAQGESINIKEKEEIRNDYQEKLIRQIEAIIKINSKFEDINVQMKVNQKNQLEEIVIVAEDNPIRPVSVDSDQNEENERNKVKKIKEELKELISSFYGLELNQIEVRLDNY